MGELYKNADKSEKELAHEEFDSNVKIADKRLDALEDLVKKLYQGEEILEAQYEKAWREHADVKSTNIKNLEELKSRYKLAQQEMIDTPTGKVKVDIQKQAISRLLDRVSKLNDRIANLKNRTPASGRG